MGSFNVSCGISNLSINEGDRIGFVMLMDAPASYRTDHTGATMRLYADELYHPYLPPVFGTYGDYGRIEDVEESITTRLIEKTFNRPAEDVVNAIASGRDLYSDMGTIAPLYLENPKSSRLGEWQVTDVDALKSVGFIEKKTDVYQYGNFVLAKLALNSWAVLTLSGDVIRDKFRVNYIHEAVSAFAEATDTFPGISSEDSYAVQTIPKLSGMFFLEEVFAELNEKVVESEERKWMAESWEKLVETLELLESSPRAAGLLGIMGESFRLLEKIAFPSERAGELLAYKDSTEFSSISTLIIMLTATNHLLQPTFNGEQDGNDPASKTLAEVSLKILEDRRKKWNDEDD